MSGNVLPFRRPARKRVAKKVDGILRVTGAACVLSLHDDLVILLLDGVEIELTEDQADELADELKSCAADVRSTKTEPKA